MTPRTRAWQTQQKPQFRLSIIVRPQLRGVHGGPHPQCLALMRRGRLVWYEPWQAWIARPACRTSWPAGRRSPCPRISTTGEFAPPRPRGPVDQFRTGPDRSQPAGGPDHHRLVRRVTAPAFSRNVVDSIQRKIEPDVKRLFDELGTPERFDYIEKIAAHIPFISITRMVGIPEKYWPDIKQVIMTFTETWNPTISGRAQEKARQDSNRAIDILKLVIAERRQAPVPGRLSQHPAEDRAGKPRL